MKKLHELLRTNRWFAVVLLLEAAVLASLAASLFGAPYKLQLTPADFSNDYPQIAAVNEDGTALQIWNNSEDFVPPEDKAITFSTAGSAMRSGAYEVTVQYFSCQTPDAPTFNALHSAGSLSLCQQGQSIGRQSRRRNAGRLPPNGDHPPVGGLRRQNAGPDRDPDLRRRPALPVRHYPDRAAHLPPDPAGHLRAAGGGAGPGAAAVVCPRGRRMPRRAAASTRCR